MQLRIHRAIDKTCLQTDAAPALDDCNHILAGRCAMKYLCASHANRYGHLMIREVPLQRFPETAPWRLIGTSVILTIMLALAAFTVTARATHGFVVWSDGFGYFVYARSLVIDHDLDITNEVDDLDRRFPPKTEAIGALRKWANRDERGQVRVTWPAGSGVVMAPFYALGYGVERAVASIEGRMVDSYGVIPQYGFCMGSAALGLLGFWCLVLMCREVAQERFAYLAGIGVVMAGPVIFFMLIHPSMSHASSFGLISLATLIWLRAWNNGPTMLGPLLIALLIGLAATVRYQNALFGILPAALVLKQWKEEGTGAGIRHGVAVVAGFLIPVALLLGSRMHIGAGHSDKAISVADYPVDLTSPYFFEVLLSCRHGAFHWAPLLGIGLIGLLWSLARKNGWAAVLLLVFLAHVYLIGGLGVSHLAVTDHPPAPGWLHRWDDTPSFGMRYLTECAPVFALGLASLMQMTAARRIATTFWGIAIGGFVCWNALLIVAYGLETISRSGCIHYADMLNGFREVLHRLGKL
jgi:hypothetical protein